MICSNSIAIVRREDSTPQDVLLPFLSSYSSVWLEQHPYKVKVTGSSPVGSTECIYQISAEGKNNRDQRMLSLHVWCHFLVFDCVPLFSYYSKKIYIWCFIWFLIRFLIIQQPHNAISIHKERITHHERDPSFVSHL